MCDYCDYHISSVVLIHFEAWAKLTQQWAKLTKQWLVCAPMGIHLVTINKELMLLVTI